MISTSFERYCLDESKDVHGGNQLRTNTPFSTKSLRCTPKYPPCPPQPCRQDARDSWMPPHWTTIVAGAGMRGGGGVHQHRLELQYTSAIPTHPRVCHFFLSRDTSEFRCTESLGRNPDLTTISGIVQAQAREGYVCCPLHPFPRNRIKLPTDDRPSLAFSFDSDRLSECSL